MNLLRQIEKKVSQKWIAYNLVLMMIGVFLFPALVFTKLWNVFYAMCVVYLILLLPYDTKFVVGENDPATFLRVERLKNSILKLCWLFLASILVLLCLTLILAFFKVEASVSAILGWLALVVAYGFTGTWFYSFTIFVYFPRRDEFARLQVRVRLSLFLDSLSKSQKSIAKNIKLYRDGLEMLNKVFRQNFDFVIKEPRRFYDYVKLMTYSLDDVVKKEIQDGLKIVITELKGKDMNPFKILGGLREVIGKSTDDKRILIEETESEFGLHRWFLTNLNVLVGFVELASGLIIVISFLIGRPA
jgi:hypothetical protein